MKTRIFAFLVVFGFVSIVFANNDLFAEPVSHEQFMETYQPLLDRVKDENLPPIRQSGIGILYNDILC